jgi:hypothetical protein
VRGIRATALLRAGLAAILLLPTSARVRAEEPHVAGLELSWDADDECPERDAVLQTVAALLPEPRVHAEGNAVVAAEVRVERLPDRRFRAQIHLRGATAGDRQLEGADCRRVAEAAALIIALTLDPLGTTAGVVERSPAGGGDEQLRLAIGARAAGDIGSLPQPSLGAGVVLGAQLGPAHAALEAVAWLPRVTGAGASDGGSGEIGLFSAALRGCYDLVSSGRQRLGFGPCLGAEAGVSTGRGIAVLAPARRNGFWGAALAGLSVRQLGRGPGLGSWLSLELAVPLYRPTYAIDGQGTIFRAAALASRAAVGMTWSFR